MDKSTNTLHKQLCFARTPIEKTYLQRQIDSTGKPTDPLVKVFTGGQIDSGLSFLAGR